MSDSFKLSVIETIGKVIICTAIIAGVTFASVYFDRAAILWFNLLILPVYCK